MMNTGIRTITLLTLIILALAITGTAAGNEMTFVLGTDENHASLLNASENATIKINIYNATQAMSIDFANERVVFLASLDNETVAHINSTINESASIIGSLVIRVTQPDKSCIQRVPLEVKIYALEQMFDV